MPLSASGPSLRNGGVSQVSGNCYEWFTYGLSGRPAFLTTARACPAGPLDRVRQAFVDVSVMSYVPDGEATERFVRYSDYGRANDVLLLQLYTSVHLPDGEVRRLLGLFDAGGFWSDIDYDDRTRGRWQPSLHLTRMYALAKLYADPASAWHGDGRIGGLLHKGLAYWYAKKPSSLNWWHGEIGVPKKLAAILLMIRGELSGPELEQGLRIIERSRFGRTGQNKVWLAGNNLMRGLLTDDEALVAEARDQIAEEIVVTDGEGIQDDWSFHQHGPQIQFGNYGLAYAEGLSFWLRVLDGTPYMFSDAQCAVIEKLMREGICRSIWRGVMDPSFCGRQVFIDSGPGKASSAAVAAENIAALKRPGYRVFRRFAKRILEPENRSDGLRGPRYYGRSDCGIYRTATWYASIRMHSDRTIGFEFTNRENTLANFSADGALLFMQHGREYDNIFAHWDWRMVPGTTAYDDGAPLKCDNSVEARKNRSGHVGGLASGDVLCTTMEIERDGLHALKSAFFSGTSSWRWVRTSAVPTPGFPDHHGPGSDAPCGSGNPGRSDRDLRQPAVGASRRPGIRIAGRRSDCSQHGDSGGKMGSDRSFLQGQNPAGAGFQVLVRA